MKTAIFPGSFDPFTRGHEAIVEKALHLFDKVIIGIGSNVAKQGLLSVENRKRLIDDYYAGDARVEAMIYGGMTGDFAQQVGAAAVIRGVRNTTDFEYERTMAAGSTPPWSRSCSSRRPTWPTSPRRRCAKCSRSAVRWRSSCPAASNWRTTSEC